MLYLNINLIKWSLGTDLCGFAPGGGCADRGRSMGIIRSAGPLTPYKSLRRRRRANGTPSICKLFTYSLARCDEQLPI
jgi:hypothetical protein